MRRYLLLYLMGLTHAFAIISEEVIICGVCKDVESVLPKSIKIVEKIGSLFKDYRVVVYENNSTDNTPELLRVWEKQNHRVFIKSEVVSDETYGKCIINLTWDHLFYRPERIAYARNQVLDIINLEPYKKYPYIIWIDMDFETPPSIQGIFETFRTTREWDAVFCYGIDPRGNYFDWYAFRDQVHPIGAELLSDYWWHIPKKLHLSRQNDWYPVTSAFGGFGIYKRASIEGCRYAAVVTEDLAKIYEEIIQGEGNLDIEEYKKKTSLLTSIIDIGSAKPNLYNHVVHQAVKLPFSSLVWRMNSGVCQFPSVCEHVPFHASMIVKGHGKLFINPRIVFRYVER